MKRMVLLVFAVVIAVWFILNGCLRLRISDKAAIEEFTLANIPYEINTFKSGSKNIHYVKTGNALLPHIVFVHGSPGSWKDFKKYLKDIDLLKRYCLISIDRPGFGYSNFGDPLSLQNESDVIVPFLKSINTSHPIILVGHSLGGPLVSLLAADFQTNVSYIMILAGALDPLLEPKENWRKAFIDSPLQYLLPGALRPSNKELWYLKTDLYDLQPKLPLIKCNVIIMHGQKDMLVDVKNVDYIKKRFTNAKSIKDTLFPKENHFIPWTRYKEIKAALLQLAE